MLKNILRTAILGIALLFGTTTVLAASVDTSLLISTDLDTYDMEMKVESVTEDTDTYYVNYSYHTLEAVDGVWQDVSRTGSMKVSKKDLGNQDLGLYAANQMNQVANQQKTYLKDVQKVERGSQNTETSSVAEYSGIVGQSLDSEEKTFEGYQPVKPIAATEAVLGVTSLGSVAVSEESDFSETNTISNNPSFDALSSKISLLEEKLQALTDLVTTLTEFYTTFDLASFLRKDGA